MVTKEEARKNIEEFLQLYKNHLAAGKFDEQKEANTEKYIEDLFEKLGWDRYDLERQHTIKEGRVDYAVNLDGHPYFFVEVKKYSTKDLDQHKKQAIDYAWQAQIKWVVLTNLREFRIYNAEYKGQPEEIMRVVQPIQIDQLLERFSHLWWLSKEAAQENLIEKEAVAISKVKLKEPISALSESLLRWRSLLTKEMKAHPKLNEISGLDKDAANEWVDEAVQMLLNRFIFLRTIESLGQWTFSLRAVRNKWRDNQKKHLMEYVSEFFREADAKYNAGLFAKHKCEDLHLNDEVLDRIIEETYVDKAHDVEWDFRALVSDQDILGLAYEQYLGATLTEKTAKVKESKEKRKKMGIYYTPKYVVDYIVENTLGEVLKKTKDQDITNLKILDPACGSGSFIKDAYRRLTKEISKRGVDKQLYLNKESSEETQFSIYDTALKNCIKGVDLDKKAVEMARLNMLILGAETGVHRLPNIDTSIQKGNSLIDEFSIAGKNAFRWEENFKDVFEQGGFDVVIGNPPYVNIHSLPTGDIDFYRSRYVSADRQFDLFVLFIEKAVSLLKEGGKFGFIVPALVIRGYQYSKIRKYILDQTKINVVYELGDSVFEGVQMPTCILILEKCSNAKARTTNQFSYMSRIGNEISQFKHVKRKQSDLKETDGYIIEGLFDPISKEVLTKMEHNSIPLENIAKVNRGLELSKKHEDISNERKEKEDIPILSGEEVDRYLIKKTKFIRKKLYDKFSKDSDFFEDEKVLIRETGARLTAVYDNHSVVNLRSLYNIRAKDKVGLKYILALLNSKLFQYYYAMKFKAATDVFPKIRIAQVKKMPIKLDKKYEAPITALVDKIMEINKRFIETKETKLQNERDKIDSEIDDLVYKVYSITEEEKKVIGESLK